MAGVCEWKKEKPAQRSRLFAKRGLERGHSCPHSFARRRAGGQECPRSFVWGRCLTTPLVITCPSNIVVLTCSTNIAVDWTNPAMDLCSLFTVTSSPPPGSLFNRDTTNTVTVTATDACGNSDSCTFLVIVRRPSLSISSGISGGVLMITITWVDGRILQETPNLVPATCQTCRWPRHPIRSCPPRRRSFIASGALEPGTWLRVRHRSTERKTPVMIATMLSDPAQMRIAGAIPACAFLLTTVCLLIPCFPPYLALLCPSGWLVFAAPIVRGVGR
jgi:hypothetical protein